MEFIQQTYLKTDLHNSKMRKSSSLDLLVTHTCFLSCFPSKKRVRDGAATRDKALWGKLKGERRDELIGEPTESRNPFSGVGEKRVKPTKASPVQIRKEACATGIVDSTQVANFLWV